ncbi:hypothetical protein B0I03_1026 [Flavobacterium aquaticum]|uniref:YD repeat-containing protein n=1 Tax=Flavobacterium aquaticum TaxID=1236486 RepID=A0A327YW91_9FLAO|nr:hypothetical protein [Flavobacterium aquaticum]RAK24157.1 hypothetical protein B0I03_1026 [Flavobacterium aquaticum]
MKFHILFLFWFANIFAQQQFRTSDFGYSDDVIKVEESLYKFDKDQNKFIKENYYITEIKNTYVQRQILENIYQEEKISGEYLYVYNSDLTLKEINYKPIIGNFGHPIRFLFNYEKGKLERVIVEHMSSTTYEYDKKGNLIKEVELNADDEPSETIFYEDYIDKKSYTKIKKSNDGSGSDFTKEIYKDGLLIEKNMISEDFKSNTKYSYDNFRNVISQVYDDSSRIDFNYEFDANNNRIKIAKVIPAMPDDNSFAFAKITYADGTTSGSTELDLNFIKKYDEVFREKDSLLQQYRKVVYSRKDYLSVLKGHDSVIEIQDSYDNNFEKVVQLVDTPEHSSLVIFNEVDQSIHFVKGFYLDDFAKHEWHDAIKLISPTGIYWVKNNKFKISFYQDGKYLQSSNFSIENDENPNHLVVKSVDGTIYQIQNVDTSEAGRLYPLFKK